MLASLNKRPSLVEVELSGEHGRSLLKAPYGPSRDRPPGRCTPDS